MRQQAGQRAQQRLASCRRPCRYQDLELRPLQGRCCCCCLQLLLLKVKQLQQPQLLLQEAAYPVLLLRAALHAEGYQVQVVLLLQLLRG
jgi:hypothetical protein